MPAVGCEQVRLETLLAKDRTAAGASCSKRQYTRLQCQAPNMLPSMRNWRRHLLLRHVDVHSTAPQHTACRTHLGVPG